jgi:hypothetical protein
MRSEIGVVRPLASKASDSGRPASIAARAARRLPAKAGETMPCTVSIAPTIVMPPSLSMPSVR